MTRLATLPVPTEKIANRLAEAISDSDELGWPTVATTEQKDGSWTVEIYHEDALDEAALGALTEAVLGPDAPAFIFTELPDENWVAKSLEGLKPVRAGRFLVHGSHDRDKAGIADIAIEIEAGLAFGTGHHGTTAGCLLAIDALGKARRYARILDLGTGTGVLAIAMAKAWKRKVLATDIDPVAVAVAHENARLNGVGPLVETAVAAGFGHPVFTARAPFDLVVANILAGPLVALSAPLARRLAPRATVVLSGLLTEQGPRVVAAYRRQGLRLARADARDGWLTLVLEKGR
ncbi:50S ribosomal protein L11 methyltransferase [Prosthecomicrobium pneumaticum]|uniref:Ribosomal protein L11 methyltransferase n=1 Tax=Prosthecomicrobium pneumaticum TaxID=81895 RepID=A0A7W9L462_9HYPH|nr:50S ribosomal protein L11 methyltransferase [Prosthecomicrobium pneumaticum]MBB5755258.1 ribosomal protein L11 methyltransferase [Prosthecomicrobium pneumaticum]